MYISGGVLFSVAVSIGDHIAKSIFMEFLNPDFVQGLSLLLGKSESQLHRVGGYLGWTSRGLILLGFLTLLTKRTNLKFNVEFKVFSLINVLIAIAGMMIPYFASSLNATRLYHITLIFIAPFLYIGGITLFKILSRLVGASWTDQWMKNSLKVLFIFLAISFLFNSSWVFEMIEGSSHPLFDTNNLLDYPRFNEMEVFGAKWLCNKVENGKPIIVDSYRYYLLKGFQKKYILKFGVNKIEEKSSIYLGTLNIINKTMLVKSIHGTRKTMEYFELGDIANSENKIYTNGGSTILYQSARDQG